MWCRGVVVITTAPLHLTKPELMFCAGSNLVHSVLKIHDGEDLWQWSRLKIRLNIFQTMCFADQHCSWSLEHNTETKNDFIKIYDLSKLYHLKTYQNYILQKYCLLIFGSFGLFLIYFLMLEFSFNFLIRFYKMFNFVNRFIRGAFLFSLYSI